MTMERKILPYDIDNRGYFPADILSLSILKSYNDKISVLYGFHNIFAYQYTSPDKKIFYNVEIDWESPTLCRKHIPRCILHKDHDFSLLDFIASSIEEDYYVYMTVDSSKIRCYSNYNTVFAPHPMVIYGYDRRMKNLYIADFLNGVGYQKQTISFEELLNANCSLLEEMKMLDAFKGTNESILDIELIKYLKNCDLLIDTEYIKHSIKNFIYGRDITGSHKCIFKNRILPRTYMDENKKNYYYEANTMEEAYGIRVFEGIVDFYKNSLTSNEYDFNFRHTFVINTYYELFLSKMVFLNEHINNYSFSKMIEQIINDADYHKERMRLAILLSIKYSIKGETNDLCKVINILEKEIAYIAAISIRVLNALE